MNFIEHNIIVKESEIICVKFDPSNHHFHNAATVAQTLRYITN